MPMIIRTRKMLRHMRTNRKKMVASMPIWLTRFASLVFHNGVTHAHGFLPIGGGACFSSACFNLGAYRDW